MTSDDIRVQIRSIRDEVLEVARKSITVGDVNKFNKLNEVAVILTELSSGNEWEYRGQTSVESRGESNAQQTEVDRTNVGTEGFHTLPKSKIIPVFARYHGTRHEAKLDASRIENNGRGECINFGGAWMTPSKATSLISTNRPSAWRFWRYTRPDGTEGRIQEILDSSTGKKESPKPVNTRTHRGSSGIRSTIHTILSAESPLHRKVILEKVLNGGVHIGGKTTLRTLAAHLSDDDRFEAVGGGNWALSRDAADTIRNDANTHRNDSMTSSVSTSDLRNAVFSVLTSERPLHRSVIYERVLRRGIHVGGKSPINNLGAHMSGDLRFKSDGNGNWTLATDTEELQGQVDFDEEYDDEDVPW